MQAQPVQAASRFSLPLRVAGGPSLESGDRYEPSALRDKPFDPAPSEGGKVETRSLPGWMRGVSLALVGAIGLGAVGCTRAPDPPPVDGTVSQDAREQLSRRLTEIESELKAGETQNQDPSGATRKFMDAVKEYARKTGRSADQVARDLRGSMIEHPALTLTVAYGLGVAAGIGLEKLGLSEQLEKGVDSIVQAVKEHPILAIAVAAAAVGAVIYFVYDAVQTESQAIPPAPQTPEAQKLRQAFDDLEKQASESTGDTRTEAQKIDRTLKERIAEYARSTGRSAEQVRQDVMQFYVEHPGVSAAVVLAAGVGTGVLLERAGVPAHVAGAAEAALKASKNGLAGVTETVKEHPVLATAIGVGLAAGAGYAIYQSMQN
ncbi:MAG: hypothetical protein AB1758_15960 [Candidatus Eremiobacterota bacterium]